MQVVEGLDELRLARAGLPGSLGLVPTMGFLHDGHLSLVRRSKAECSSTAVSIFVNPSQFGPGEDLSAYPRDLDRDLRLLQEAGVDLVWTPSAECVYPPGFQTWVSVEQVARSLEGAQRPGHFRGVATMVAKLFLAFRPDRAYFGQKDFQQAVVIRRMVSDLYFPLDVVVCPIVREADGLAMSSRNSYLSPEERAAAPVLSRALYAAQAAYEAGERRAEELRQVMLDTLAREALAQPDYVSVAEPETLEEMEGMIERGLLSMAVRIGRARLIDNLILDRHAGTIKRG
jgi:pantoate--beta-alanine ligase